MKGALRFRFGLLICLLGVGPLLDKPLVYGKSTRSLPPNLTILLTQVIYLHWIDGAIWFALTKLGPTWQRVSDPMEHLAMARELQMTILPSSEMLLTTLALNIDYCFEFAALTPFGLSTCAGHTTLWLGFVVTLGGWKCFLQPKVCLD